MVVMMAVVQPGPSIVELLMVRVRLEGRWWRLLLCVGVVRAGVAETDVLQHALDLALAFLPETLQTIHCRQWPWRMAVFWYLFWSHVVSKTLVLPTIRLGTARAPALVEARDAGGPCCCRRR